jgi:hypothetical protein
MSNLKNSPKLWEPLKDSFLLIAQEPFVLGPRIVSFFWHSMEAGTEKTLIYFVYYTS